MLEREANSDNLRVTLRSGETVTLDCQTARAIAAEFVADLRMHDIANGLRKKADGFWQNDEFRPLAASLHGIAADLSKLAASYTDEFQF